MGKPASPKHSPNRGRGYRVPLIVGLCVFGILAAALLFYYDQPASPIIQDWRVHVVFYDYRYGINYSLPPNIGVFGGLWTNHTLDQYGAKGYSPLSTRDDTSTIHVSSNVLEVYTFSDFFNVWGQQFNTFCVPLPPLWDPTHPYCTGSGDTVVYDPDNSTVVDSQTQIIYTSPTAPHPALGTALTIDPLIKYVDTNGNNKFDPGEIVAYDLQNTGSLASTDWIINATATPTQGLPLSSDPHLRFVDSREAGAWLQPRTPPGMADQTGRDSCITNDYALSNHEDWTIFLYSGIASSIQGNCLSG